MQLIKSLFCWHGFDNRNRFIVIALSCFLTFIILNQSLSEHKLSAIAVLLLCSSIYLATTWRRVNNAQLHKNWIIAPVSSFLIANLLILFIDHSVSYWFLLVPILLALLLLTYPSKSHRQYILGYSGPINLADFMQVQKVNSRSNQRVEPTMNNINVSQIPINQRQHSSTTGSIESSLPSTNASHPTDNVEHSAKNNQHQSDIGESIRLVLLSKKNIRITFAVIGLLFVVALVISLTFSSSPSKKAIQAQKNIIQETSSNFQHQLILPGGFSIMTSPKNGIVLNWQAKVKDNSAVWSLDTATGDKSCENIVFNDNEAIRTYSVSVMGSEYHAYFSPLDTKALIKNIAFKNKFVLCGYNFSLKGSQATLGKSPFYGNLIEY